MIPTTIMTFATPNISQNVTTLWKYILLSSGRFVHFALSVVHSGDLCFPHHNSMYTVRLG